MDENGNRNIFNNINLCLFRFIFSCCSCAMSLFISVLSVLIIIAVVVIVAVYFGLYNVDETAPPLAKFINQTRDQINDHLANEAKKIQN